MEENTIQEIIFQLIERSNFNEFNGKKVVEDLKKNSDLWKGVIMDRPGNNLPIDLTKLRDISDNQYNVDTIFIIPKKGKESQLYKLAKKWKSDEIDWIGGELACQLLGEGLSEIKNNPKVILRIWWD